MRTENQTQQYPNRSNYPDIKNSLHGRETGKENGNENDNKVQPEEREHIVDDEGEQVNPSDNHNGNREHLVDDDDIPAGLSPA